MIRLTILILSLLSLFTSCSSSTLWGLEGDEIKKSIQTSDGMSLLRLITQAKDENQFTPADILRVSPGAGFVMAQAIAALPAEDLDSLDYDMAQVRDIVEQLYLVQAKKNSGSLWYWWSLEQLVRGYLAEQRYEEMLELLPGLTWESKISPDMGAALMFPWYTAHRLEALMALNQDFQAYREIQGIMTAFEELEVPSQDIHPGYFYYLARLAAREGRTREDFFRGIGGYLTRVSPRNGHAEVVTVLLDRLQLLEGLGDAIFLDENKRITGETSNNTSSDEGRIGAGAPGSRRAEKTDTILAGEIRGFLTRWGDLLLWKLGGLREGIQSTVRGRMEDMGLVPLEKEEAQSGLLPDRRSQGNPELLTELLPWMDRQFLAELLLRADEPESRALLMGFLSQGSGGATSLGIESGAGALSRSLERASEGNGLYPQQVALFLEYAGRAASKNGEGSRAEKLFIRGYEGLNNPRSQDAQRLLWLAMRSLLSSRQGDQHAGLIRLLTHVADPEYFLDILEPYMAEKIEYDHWNDVYLLLKHGWQQLPWMVRGQGVFSLSEAIAAGMVAGFDSTVTQELLQWEQEIRTSSASLYYRMLANRDEIARGAIGSKQLVSWYYTSGQSEDSEFEGDLDYIPPRVERELRQARVTPSMVHDLLTQSLELGFTEDAVDYLSGLFPGELLGLEDSPRTMDLLLQVSQQFFDRGEYYDGILVSRLGFFVPANLEEISGFHDAGDSEDVDLLSGGGTIDSLAEGSRSDLRFELLRGIFPRAFQFEVTDALDDGIPESVFYGLLRSESLFDPAARSWAGAMGLGQLMPATADDMASRMRIGDYDPYDPKTNIAISVFYLEYLRNRLSGLIPVLAGYNAGYGRARGWVSDWDINHGILWAERIPFAETRGYIRKIVTATLFYEILYQENPNTNLVEKIFTLKD